LLFCLLPNLSHPIVYHLFLSGRKDSIGGIHQSFFQSYSFVVTQKTSLVPLSIHHRSREACDNFFNPTIVFRIPSALVEKDVEIIQGRKKKVLYSGDKDAQTTLRPAFQHPFFPIDRISANSSFVKARTLINSKINPSRSLAGFALTVVFSIKTAVVTITTLIRHLNRFVEQYRIFNLEALSYQRLFRRTTSAYLFLVDCLFLIHNVAITRCRCPFGR
jgi:hypothetical protein